jgi:PTS system fructose-specific IIA component
LETFDISKVLDNNLVSLSLNANTKKEAIEKLTDLLVKNGNVNSREGFVEDVLLREKEGMTGLGQGIAIPHGKSKFVNTTSLCIGISKHLINWESLDGKPVNTVILFAVRDKDADTLHIKLLQRVAILLADDTFIAKLHGVTTKEELIHLFRSNQEE